MNTRLFQKKEKGTGPPACMCRGRGWQPRPSGFSKSLLGKYRFARNKQLHHPEVGNKEKPFSVWLTGGRVFIYGLNRTGGRAR